MPPLCPHPYLPLACTAHLTLCCCVYDPGSADPPPFPPPMVPPPPPCGVVWCGVVRCGLVWSGLVWSGLVWCGVVWCGVVWCGPVVWWGPRVGLLVVVPRSLWWLPLASLGLLWVFGILIPMMMILMMMGMMITIFIVGCLRQNHACFHEASCPGRRMYVQTAYSSGDTEMSRVWLSSTSPFGPRVTRRRKRASGQTPVSSTTL